MPLISRRIRSFPRATVSLSILKRYDVGFVTLGFDFDGLCYFVPDGFSLLFAQTLVASTIILCEQALPAVVTG
jgi:hypothetical protein